MSTPICDGFLSVAPTVPVAPYLGGKRLLARRLIEKIKAIPHRLYAEPFVGMGGVFLRRPHRVKTEVLNDFSRDIANFFRILQRHYPQFLDVLRFQLTTRADFERLTATPPETMTDLERAARFLYLQRAAYGGRTNYRNFGVTRTHPARFDLNKLKPMLADVHTRLASVIIECLPYGDFIARYDRPDALFYLDPPYWGCEKEYGAGQFERGDFERIAAILKTFKGAFILSINDRPEVREIFSGFTIEAVPVRYSIPGATKGREFPELIVTP